MEYISSIYLSKFISDAHHYEGCQKKNVSAKSSQVFGIKLVEKIEMMSMLCLPNQKISKLIYDKC